MNKPLDLTNLSQIMTNVKTYVDGCIPATLPPSGAAGGELSGSYPNPTLSNDAVINKVLTGLNSSYSGYVINLTASDTILSAVGKITARLKAINFDSPSDNLSFGYDDGPVGAGILVGSGDYHISLQGQYQQLDDNSIAYVRQVIDNENIDLYSYLKEGHMQIEENIIDDLFVNNPSFTDLQYPSANAILAAVATDSEIGRIFRVIRNEYGTSPDE